MIRMFAATTIITLALAVPASAAAAPKIPAEFHGTWCSEPDNGSFPKGNTRQDFVGFACSQDGGGSELEVTADGFTGFGGEMTCKVLKVEKFNLNNVRKGIRNPWGPAYRVRFRCVVEEDRPFVTKAWSWQIQKGYIVMDVAK
jgi:hypothetical protein